MVARFHQKGFMQSPKGKLLLLVLFLATVSPIWGTVQAAQGKSKAKKTQQSQSPVPAVTGIFTMSTATNTLSADEIVEITGTYSLALTFNLPEVSSYHHNLILAMGYTAAYTHAMEGDRGGDLVDPIFNYGVILGDHGIFKSIRVGVGGLVPVNKETRNTSMQAAFGPTLNYNFDLGKVIGLQRWGYRHAWYEYDT